MLYYRNHFLRTDAQPFREQCVNRKLSPQNIHIGKAAFGMIPGNPCEDIFDVFFDLAEGLSSRRAVCRDSSRPHSMRMFVRRRKHATPVDDKLKSVGLPL